MTVNGFMLFGCLVVLSFGYLVECFVVWLFGWLFSLFGLGLVTCPMSKYKTL